MPSHWTEHDISINGVQLHYYRTGDGTAPPLVLQHGFSDNGLCWTPTARDLEAEYDVIMPDARGHGLSARIRPGDTFDMTADLAGIIQSLGLRRPIVAGHSMGALIASQLAARFPDIPRALILEDPPYWQVPAADETHATAKRKPFATWFREMAALPLEQAIARTRAEHPTWPDDVLQTWCAAKKQLDLTIFDTGLGQPLDWQDVVAAIACPTLLIIADPDKGGLVTPEAAALAAKMNHNISVVHIPDTGHHIRFTNYTAYMDAVRAFLAQLAPQTPT